MIYEMFFYLHLEVRDENVTKNEFQLVFRITYRYENKTKNMLNAANDASHLEGKYSDTAINYIVNTLLQDFIEHLSSFLMKKEEEAPGDYYLEFCHYKMSSHKKHSQNKVFFFSVFLWMKFIKCV